jgi:hypothetical protein
MDETFGYAQKFQKEFAEKIDADIAKIEEIEKEDPIMEGFPSFVTE